MSGLLLLFACLSTTDKLYTKRKDTHSSLLITYALCTISHFSQCIWCCFCNTLFFVLLYIFSLFLCDVSQWQTPHICIHYSIVSMSWWAAAWRWFYREKKKIVYHKNQNISFSLEEFAPYIFFNFYLDLVDICQICWKHQIMHMHYGWNLRFFSTYTYTMQHLLSIQLRFSTLCHWCTVEIQRKNLFKTTSNDNKIKIYCRRWDTLRWIDTG